MNYSVFLCDPFSIEWAIKYLIGLLKGSNSWNKWNSCAWYMVGSQMLLAFTLSPGSGSASYYADQDY